MFTNRMLAHRCSRCDPQPLRTGADSFKRMLGGWLGRLSTPSWYAHRHCFHIAESVCVQERYLEPLVSDIRDPQRVASLKVTDPTCLQDCRVRCGEQVRGCGILGNTIDKRIDR